jgi:aspartate/methionine/tyrosine aminotransferase
MTDIRPFALERYFARHEFSARYLLGSSDPEAMTTGDLLAFEPGSEKSISDVWLGYTESLGDPRLRNDISKHYKQISPEQILVFTGAEEPIFAFMHAALKPGDHLIVHFPSYQSHYSVAESRGIEVSHWCGRPDQSWAPDLNELETLIKPNTRAILICTPHNPTGYLFDLQSLNEIIKIADKHGLYIFSDEVYRGTEHNPADRLPNMADLYEKGISLNCLSKNCGLAGLRTGWIATRCSRLYNRLATFKDYLTICNCAPGEFLAGIAVRNMEKIFAIQRQRLVNNLDLLESFFNDYQDLFKWQRPKAGTTTFPEFLKGDALEFCDKLVADTGIMLIPGNFFDLPGQYMRFGYGRANLPEVLQHFRIYLQQN